MPKYHKTVTNHHRFALVATNDPAYVCLYGRFTSLPYLEA